MGEVGQIIVSSLRPVILLTLVWSLGIFVVLDSSQNFWGYSNLVMQMGSSFMFC